MNIIRMNTRRDAGGKPIVLGVSDRVGLNRSQIDRLVRSGNFPRPIRITPRSIAWIEEEVDAWIAERAAAREKKNA